MIEVVVHGYYTSKEEKNQLIIVLESLVFANLPDIYKWQKIDISKEEQK